MARPSNREPILDAFEGLLTEQGAGAVTLDAVAERAGVSKGGLTYHFRSKADLIAGFAERLLARIDHTTASAPHEPSAIIRWYLDYDLADSDEAMMWRSLVAALHGADEGLRLTVHDAIARYAQPLLALPPELADHVRLIGDGLFLNALLNTPRLPANRLECIIEELVARLPAS